ncbi:serine hydrolase domain-containing protein [Brassicibacter mesophilus]|uniref:serine hydrolase domain-containing protein n=1 Tax=Brassicibacter mesophilus TaxID=745119 RepID=UPI003D1BA8AE
MNKKISIKIDEYFKELERKKEFSGTILVAMEDHVIIKESYGISNHDFDLPNTLNTKFCVASITKSITAMAIMILAQQNKLDLNDTLDMYIPDYSNGNKIMIHHLLTHTSGLSSLYNNTEYQMYIRENHTFDEYIDKFKHNPSANEPGEKFEYSNMGYSLLSYIIENVSAKTYNDFIIENIFDKLCMKNTGCFRNERILKNRASGYSMIDGKLVNCSMKNISAFYGAGDLYSTIEDMYAWTKALLKRELLNEVYSEKLLRDYGQVYDDFYYGYGKIMFKKNNKIKYFYQDGGLPGFKSIYLIYPEKHVTVILLSNYDFINMMSIINKIEEIVFQHPSTFKID